MQHPVLSKLISKNLQLEQVTAAKILTGIEEYEYITLVPTSPHYLPIATKFAFKEYVYTYIVDRFYI